jgi:hypothetical protein
MARRKEPIFKGDPILYRADGTQEVVKPAANGRKFELKELKEFVHGTAAVAHLDSRVRFCVVSRAGELETVEIDPKANNLMIRDGWVMVMNENGLNERLPLNKEASRLFGGIIVGDVVLCRFDATPWHGVRGFRAINLGGRIA